MRRPWRDWDWLVGPTFGFEVVRTARHGRHLLYRCLYAGLLLITLFVIYRGWLPGRQLTLEELFRPVPVDVKLLPRFTESFFHAFAAVQLATAFLFTPAYVAGAIVGERQRRTLECLLTTDLSAQEVVRGKLAGRSADLFLLLFTGLPVLGFLQLLGGVDPEALLALFAATAATVLSVTSLSLWCSASTPTLFEAALTTYLGLLFWSMGSLVLVCCWFLPGFNFGNPLVVFIKLAEGSFGSNLTLELVGYTAFHVAFAVIFSRRAAWELLRAPLEPPQPLVLPAPAGDTATQHGRKWTEQPLLDERPIVWKELGPGVFPPRPASALTLSEFVLFALVAAYLYYSLVLLLAVALALGESLPHEMANAHLRMIGVPLACALFLTIALSAATRVSRERERQTLESLLACPPEREEVLWDKWQASIRCIRPGWWLGCPLWGYALLFGGLHILAAPLLFLAWAAYAAFAASLGLWFSVISRTSTQALVRTVSTLLLLVGVPALLLPVPLHPPAALWALSFDYWQLDTSRTRNVVFALLNVAGYAAAAWWLWRASRARMRRDALGVEGDE